MQIKRTMILLVFLFVFSSVLYIQISPIVCDGKTVSSKSKVSIVSDETLNWQLFWKVFNSYAKWDLECDFGFGWVSVKEDLTIRRDFPRDDTCKITLIFDSSHAGDYRLTFGIDARVRKHVERLDKYQYELSYDEFSVIFDWSDIISIVNLEITHGVREVASENFFWFRLRRDNVPQGVRFELDPSIVVTETGADTSMFFQRRAFNAENNHWVFWQNTTSFKYSSSGDGSSWTQYTIYTDAVYGVLMHRLGVWFDGTFFHYAMFRITSSSTTGLFYCRGTPYSNGSIVWGSEQTIGTYGVVIVQFVNIVVDSSSYPCVAYFNDTSNKYFTQKALATDGSSWDAQVELGSSTVSPRNIALVPLQSDRLYVTYIDSALKLYGKLYDGSSWGSEEGIYTAFMTDSISHCIVAEGDDVHCVYGVVLPDGSYDDVYVFYNKRVYDSGWGSQLTLWFRDNAGAGSTYPSVTISLNSATGDLRVFWKKVNDDGYLYLRHYVNTTDTWRSGVKPFGDVTPTTNTITSWYSSSDGKAAIAWCEGTTIKYGANMPPTIGEFQAPSTIYAGEYFLLNCTVNDEDGKTEIENATIEITNDIILKYDNATDTFSEYQDTNGYCTLDVSGSVRTEVNSTSFKLSWRIKLSYSCPEGNISIVSTNTKVIDSGGETGSNSQSNLFYFDKKHFLNLRTLDADGEVFTVCTVYMNDGTQHSKTPSSPGWANWTGITANSVTVSVKFLGVTVNSTTITMDNNKTIDLSCRAYPFTMDATKYHVASNVIISSTSWNATLRRFILSFSGSVSTYTLVCNCPIPTFIWNCSYNLDTDYTSYLSLTHYGNQTITLAYPNWVGTRIQRTDHRMINTYWSGDILYMILDGTTNQIGTLKIFCSGRGVPRETGGLTNPIYDSSTTILSGTYTFGSQVTAWVKWPAEGGGGGSQPSMNVFASAQSCSVGLVQQGTSRSFNASVLWNGTSYGQIVGVSFSGEGSSWFVSEFLVPYVVTRVGTIYVPVVLSVPSNARLGSYSVEVEYEFKVGTQTYTSSAEIGFSVSATPVGIVGIPTIVTALLLVAMVGVVLVGIKYKKTRK